MIARATIVSVVVVAALVGGCLPAADEVDGSQLPPTEGHDAIEAWLAEGHYRRWSCDPLPRPARLPSIDGTIRVCANDMMIATTSGEFPVDAAAVKEIHDPAGAAIIGYSVERHTRPGAGGETWYWYERGPLDGPEPHDERGVVADGWGFDGPAVDQCVACHSLAGSPVAPFGRHLVFTRIP